MPLAQEIEVRVGSDGFGEERWIRRDHKYGAPRTMSLSEDMICAADNKMIVETKGDAPQFLTRRPEHSPGNDNG